MRRNVEYKGDVAQSGISRRTFVKSSIVAATAFAINRFDASSLLLHRQGSRILRFGTPFGATSSMDPHLAPQGNEGLARNFAVFEKLMEYTAQGEIVPHLAEAIYPNTSASSWIIRLRPDVLFHDGNPLTADDVIYSISRILDPSLNLEGRATLSMIDPTGLQKLDDLTIEVALLLDYADFPTQFAQKPISIIRNGTTNFETLIGTGPFRIVSATQNNISFVANDQYWRSGFPKVEGLEFIRLDDSIARLNAILAGQVDVINPVDTSQIAIIHQSPNVVSVISEGAGYVPFQMKLDVAPFDDNRVRTAMKYLVDREQIIAQAANGLGRLGNDLFARIDPLFPNDIPQREYDPEHAISLLRDAGVADATFTLHTADIFTNQLRSAEVFAQQATQAGLNLEIRRWTADQYIPRAYGHVGFSQNAWGYRPILQQIAEAFLPTSPDQQTTQWLNDRATTLYNQAIQTTDLGLRREMIRDWMQIFWDEGPYVIWGFDATVDAYSTRVRGYAPNVIRAVNNFNFTELWIEE